MSEDPLGKLDYHPKLAEATKDDRLKTSRPVTTPTLPTSKNRKTRFFCEDYSLSSFP
ncbi:hypothetical protein JOD43_003546 [Pullulanibacillus pueri]|nr:hypothetical protein [Pullulanibacillus pueri]